MATAEQVLKASLNRILVRSSEAPIEPDDAEDFLFTMNNFMLDLDANGASLGYTEVANIADTITIPTGALRGLIANMAIEIAPDYDGQVTQILANAARAGLHTMRLLGQTLPTTELPGTLPFGSGNDFNGSHSNNFYPDLEAEILRETTGAIGLELSTAEVVNDAT